MNNYASYVSLLSSSSASGHVALFAPKGGETAGSVAYNSTGSNLGGETAGSVASASTSSSGCCSASTGSFSAVA